MAFYRRKTGLDSFRLARTQKDTECFICSEFIERGQLRYASGWLSLCVKCAECWEKEGGKLGDISRNKK